MLTLNQQEIKEVQDYINELPTKYGVPLLNYINMKIQQQNPQVQQELPEEEKEK
jgi:2-phosphoglycerate kinase